MRFLNPVKSEPDNLQQKRRHERRAVDQCIAEINGKKYPVINWSQGGAMIYGDDRLFGKDETLDMTLKFHLRDRILPVTNAARVLRKNAGGIALQFQELKAETRQTFQQVIDDIAARAFADSQV